MFAWRIYFLRFGRLPRLRPAKAQRLSRKLMRHFCDLRPIDWLGESVDFSLSHGAVQLAAEEALADIGTFEAETASETLRYCPKIGIPLELALFAERTFLAIQVVGVADRGGGTVRALGAAGGSGIGPEALGTSQAQVRGIDADALVAFRIGVVGVLFTSALIEVVGMSLIPAFDGLATAITDESKCLSHFALGLIGGFLLCFSPKWLGSSSSEAMLAAAFKRRGSRDPGGVPNRA